MRQYIPPKSLLYFSRYQWYLRALNAKKAERRKIIADIRSGLVSRDTLDEDWQKTLEGEIASIKATLRKIEFTVEGIPDTPKLLPCKLFLRLHFILGMSITETAEKMNVSLSTARRIRNTAAEYFEKYPIEI